MKNQTAHKVRNNRTTAWAGAGLALVMAFSGCGAIAEKATERAFEEALEAGIESDSGEKVEIDLDAGNGSFSISGEDGEEFSIDFDEEEGTVSMNADGEEVVMSVDEEEGTVTIEGEGDDGETSFQLGGTELPEQWPNWMPEVDGEVLSTSQIGSDDDGWFMSAAWGSTESTTAGSDVVEQLKSNGFSEAHRGTNSFDGVDMESWTLTSDEFQVLVAEHSGDNTDFSMAVTITSVS